MFQYDAAHTGYSTSAAATINWTIAWSYLRQNPTSAYGTPAIADGYLYITDGYYLYCLNASSGKLKWNQSLTTPMRLARWAFSTAISGGYVYTHSAAYDASTGQLMFNYAEEGATSPTVVNGVIYIGSTRGGVVALSASTGAKIWNYMTGSTVHSSPAIASGIVYVGSDDGNLYALNSSTGAKIWNFTIQPLLDENGLGRYMGASPAVANGTIYMGSTDGLVFALGAMPNTTPLPSPPLSDLQLTVIVAVVVIVILVIMLLVYKVRRKGAESPPPA